MAKSRTLGGRFQQLNCQREELYEQIRLTDLCFYSCLSVFIGLSLIKIYNTQSSDFYCDEIFLKGKLLPIYKNNYSFNLRNDNSMVFPHQCGPYVGSVVDEDDYFYDKNKGEIFVDNKWVTKPT